MRMESIFHYIKASDAIQLFALSFWLHGYIYKQFEKIILFV